MTVLYITDKKRIQRVCKRHFETGMCATENRGGDHRSKAFEAPRHAVKAYIESHYCRNTSTNKQYLSSTLTIKKLFDFYNSSCTEDNLKVNYEFFRKIFVTDYKFR